MDSRQFIEIIETERKKRGIKIMPYAKKVGVQRSHYYSIINGAGFGFDVACRMCAVFGWALMASKDGLSPILPSKNKSTSVEQNGKSINITINL